MTTILKYR